MSAHQLSVSLGVGDRAFGETSLIGAVPLLRCATVLHDVRLATVLIAETLEEVLAGHRSSDFGYPILADFIAN